MAFIETVGAEGPSLEAARKLRQTGDRSAFSQVKTRTYGDNPRAWKMRKMLFNEQESKHQVGKPETRMLTGFDLNRVLGLGVVAIFLAAVFTRAAAKGLRDRARMARSAQSRADIRQWADRNGYTILLREAARENPFVEESDGQVVYRVIFRDQHGAIRRGSVWCGGPLKVRWEDRVALASRSRSKRHPLWDRDLDA
jgi:hypothetical protein